MPYSEAYFVNSAVPRIPNLRITFALWNGARGAWRPSMPGPWCTIRRPAQGPAAYSSRFATQAINRHCLRLGFQFTKVPTNAMRVKLEELYLSLGDPHHRAWLLRWCCSPPKKDSKRAPSGLRPISAIEFQRRYESGLHPERCLRPR